MPTIEFFRSTAFHQPRTDFTHYGLLDRAAAYFAQTRKPRSEWKKLDDLSAQLTEFEFRYAAEDYDAASDILSAIEAYLFPWGQYQLLVDLSEKIQGKIGDKSLRMENSQRLGLADYFLGDVRKAINYWEEGLSIAYNMENRIRDSNQEIPPADNLSRISRLERPFILHLGNAYYYLGDMHKAFEYYDRSLHIAREINDIKAIGGSLCNLGLVYSEFGDFQKAIEYLEQALEISIDDRSKAAVLENLGMALIGLGNYTESAHQLSIGIKIADKLAYVHLQNFTRYDSAQAYLLLNDLPTAQVFINEAQQYDEPQNNYNVSTLTGIIALRQGERETAQEAFSKSIAQADEILAKTPDYYSALDAKGLALCGIAIVGATQWVAPTDDAIQTFRAARKIAPHAGVVKSVLRLFDELVKCDEEGVLKGVREVIAG